MFWLPSSQYSNRLVKTSKHNQSCLQCLSAEFTGQSARKGHFFAILSVIMKEVYMRIMIIFKKFVFALRRQPLNILIKYIFIRLISQNVTGIDKQGNLYFQMINREKQIFQDALMETDMCFNAQMLGKSFGTFLNVLREIKICRTTKEKLGINSFMLITIKDLSHQINITSTIL